MKTANFFVALAAFLVCNCTDPSLSPDPTPDLPPEPPTSEVERIPIRLSVSAGVSSRATDSAFESGDVVGIYVVNQENGAGGTLADSGNHLDNTRFVFDGTEWKSDREVYWKDNVTPADFYCYYPYTSTVSDVTAFPFSVHEDQSSIENYKASDLLYGRTAGVIPSENPVNITTYHALSNILIQVVPGKGYTEETLAEEEIRVSITGVQTDVKLNLATGKVTAAGNIKDITPYKENDCWRALVVPQKVDAGIVKVVIGNAEYSLVQSVVFEANKQHKCTISVSKITGGVNIGIGDWEESDTDFGGVLE